MMSAKKTLEQRLFEAFHGNRGMYLTAEDVESLLCADDAVATRVTNQAVYEFSGVGIGQNRILFKHPETWAAFKKRLMREEC